MSNFRNYIAKKNIYLCNIYRTPSYNAVQCDNCLELFDETLGKMSRTDKQSFLFTDSNFNLFKIATSNPTQKYLETLHNNGFLQIIKKATRIQGPNISNIDHICIKNLSNIPMTLGGKGGGAFFCLTFFIIFIVCTKLFH